MRCWKRFWRYERVRLEVRADNITALTLVTKLKGKCFALNLLALELAFVRGDCAFRPDVCAHTLGIASNIADMLFKFLAYWFTGSR